MSSHDIMSLIAGHGEKTQDVIMGEEPDSKMIENVIAAAYSIGTDDAAVRAIENTQLDENDLNDPELLEQLRLLNVDDPSADSNSDVSLTAKAPVVENEPGINPTPSRSVAAIAEREKVAFPQVREAPTVRNSVRVKEEVVTPAPTVHKPLLQIDCRAAIKVMGERMDLIQKKLNRCPTKDKKQINELNAQLQFIARCKELAIQEHIPIDVRMLPGQTEEENEREREKSRLPSQSSTASSVVQEVSLARKMPSSKTSSSDEMKATRKEVFVTLVRNLEEQIALWDKQMKRYYALGDKTAASSYYVEKKQFICYLEYVQAQKASLQGEIPQFSWQERSLQVEGCEDDILENEFKVAVTALVCSSLQSDITAGSTQGQLRLEFPFPAESPQVIESELFPIDLRSDLKIEACFKLERKRSLLRVIERKRLVVELLAYKRSTFAFRKSKILLGKGEYPLLNFLNVCRYPATVELLKEDRKSSMGKVAMIARMRYPLKEREIREETVSILQVQVPTSPSKTVAMNDRHAVAGNVERSTAAGALTFQITSLPMAQFLVGETRTPPVLAEKANAAIKTLEILRSTDRTAYNAGLGACLSQLQQQAASLKQDPSTKVEYFLLLKSAEIVKHEIEASSSSESVNPIRPVTETNTNTADKGAADNAVIGPTPKSPFKFMSEADLEDPNNPMRFVSYEVLEDEIGSIEKKIKGVKGPHPIPAAEQERLEILTFQKQLLEIQVMSDAFDSQAYVNKLLEHVKIEKELALYLHRKGDVSSASRALKRAKIMQHEADTAFEEEETK
jgi:hypothetical protein